MRAIWIVPVIVSILIIGTLGLSQDVFATHNAHVIVTPDRQSGLTNELQTFSVEFKSDGKIKVISGVPDSTLTITCDPPIQTNFPSKVVRFVPQDFTVKSGTPGIFICEAEVKGQGRSTGDARFRPYAVFFTFVPVFNDPSFTCGSGTVPEGNTCVQSPVVTRQITQLQSDLADCQSQNAQLTSDLVQCEADKVTLNQEIISLEGIITGLDSIIEDLKDDLAAAISEFQNLLDILLSGEITICHKEKITQTIGLDAFGTHAGHGDTIGPCE